MVLTARHAGVASAFHVADTWAVLLIFHVLVRMTAPAFVAELVHQQDGHSVAAGGETAPAMIRGRARGRGVSGN